MSGYGQHCPVVSSLVRMSEEMVEKASSFIAFCMFLIVSFIGASFTATFLGWVMRAWIGAPFPLTFLVSFVVIMSFRMVSGIHAYRMWRRGEEWY